tara:strand:- start:24 stop:530 length:507 start_codon:yes stop_codon:yes gene_type:complete
MRRFSIIILSTVLMSAFMWACKVNYSFTGISTDAETVSIQYFPNNAALAPPTLSQEFSEGLKDIFLQQTSIQLVDRGGELQFEGEIVDYKNEPIAITSNDNAAQNRLTITVNVRFVNTLDETQNFEQRFSRFEDYSSTQNLSSVESDLNQLIIDQLTQDILTRAIGNW